MKAVADKKPAVFIIDKNGKKIEVTELTSVIKQMQYFIQLQNEDEFCQKSDKTIKDYWNDIVDKLFAQKNKAEV